MKPFRKYILSLSLLNVLIITACYLFIRAGGLNISMGDAIMLLAGFTLISLITVTIFMRGQARQPDAQTMHSLVAMGLKFLLDLILALVWFVILKKNSLSFLIIFFVLYLTLTLFSVIYILKTLKNKQL